MNKWIGPVVGGVALIVGLVNLVALQGVSSRLDSLAESQLAMTHDVADSDRGSRRGGREGLVRERRGRSADVEERREVRALDEAAALGVDMDDPVAVEELTARLAERMEEREMSERETRHQTFMDEASEEVRRFGEERFWSQSTTDDVVGEVQARMESWHTLRTEMREGGVSRFEGRREMEALSEESDAKLASLMSDEDLDALRDSVLPGRGPGRGPGRR